MRAAILISLALLALSACGGLHPGAYCVGPTALEGYMIQADGSRTACIATRAQAGSATGAR